MKERAPQLSVPKALQGLAIAGVLIVPVLTVSPYWTFVLATGLAYALAALSVNVLLGEAGVIGLFTATFMGAGAFVAAAVATHVSNWTVALLAGTAACVVLGGVMGLPGTRLRGMTFGVVTFAFAVAVGAFVFSNGFLGIDPAAGAGISRPEIGGIDMSVDRNFYFLMLAIGAVAWLVVRVHQMTLPGRSWRAIRDDEVAALSVGVRVARFKIWACALSGGLAGLAGVLLLTLQSQSNAEPFSAVRSLLIFAAAVTAGVRTLAGAILAGALLAVLPELLTDAGASGDIVPLVFAAGVLVSLSGRDGITGIIGDRAARLLRSARA